MNSNKFYSGPVINVTINDTGSVDESGENSGSFVGIKIEEEWYMNMKAETYMKDDGKNVIEIQCIGNGARRNLIYALLFLLDELKKKP